MKYIVTTVLFIFSACFIFGQGADEAQKDIRPLMSAAEDGIGPLSIPHIMQCPVAAVYVFDGQQPDLFISGNTGAKTELYLCRWLKNSSDGVPVFESPVRIETDFSARGNILQTKDGQIHGLWVKEKSILHMLFDKENLKFELKNTITIPGKINNIRNLAVFPQEKGGYELVFEVNGLVVPAKYKDQNPSSPEWRPYDEAGISVQARRYTYLCAAHIPSLDSKTAENFRRLSQDNKELYFGMMQLTNAQCGNNAVLITGSRRGIFPFYELTSEKNGLGITKKKYIAGEDGNVLFHPSIAPSVCAYKEKGNKYSNLIASGEGAVYFYRSTGNYTPSGAPVYKDPTPVLQTHAPLDAGSLPSFSVADWDGDSVEDIITGNSEGFILFYKNIGSNEEPAFLPETRIKAAGKDIQIQAGYSGSVQGTQESRWGYVSPTVVDWNEDGLPDLILGDITGCYTIYLNRGTKEQPKLEAGHPLFCEGLNLHGTWRCRAAAGKFGNRMALSVVDDEGYVRMYWKIDDYNLEDGGRLEMEDGSSILTHAEPAGGTGRCKLSFFDYDGDGKPDMIIGNGRRNAIPNLKTGYPLPVLGKKTQGTPLFMKNIGKSSDEKPVFSHPQPFFHSAIGIVQPGGAHETGVVGTYLGGGKTPNLIVGDEQGRIYLLKGENMRFMDVKEASKYRDYRNPFSNGNNN